MCGIFCSVLQNNKLHSYTIPNTLKEILRNRGPDVQDEMIEDYDTGQIIFAGNVLWQQGESIQKQPVVANDFILLFNGDIYNLPKPETMSDTSWIASQISECRYEEKKILQLLKNWEGPHCLIIYDKRKQILYFSRDALGRNSLIIERIPKELHLLSASYYLENDKLSLELPPLGLYKVNINDLTSCVLHPWCPLNNYSIHLLSKLDQAVGWKTTVESPMFPEWMLKSKLTFNYDFYKFTYIDCHVDLFKNLISQPQITDSLATLHKLLSDSVRKRVTNRAPLCRLCLIKVTIPTVCTHAKLSILFSGGIDCTILALLANEFVPENEPIELINVAFESIDGQNISEELWNVPDRKTALLSINELNQLCPKRYWKLLEVNVTRQELEQHLTTRIKHLIYPLETVLDESLGCAFWFASHCDSSTARVALIGSGADELFGGYARHRNCYRHCMGSAMERQLAVHDELEMDWQRLPARNLARDDRVIADNGKTARSPFIEENVVKFIRSLEPYQKCCFSFPEGVGDKLLLRLYGYQIGLRGVVLLKKRAIQFGSRIANKKQKATNKSDNLKQKLETM
ncbi:asparagine synthetase domain-containing protein CG17486 [Drosophila biarmipes]|uniref:asparagine synthetase domain-containing protein CG17486 n=1 Tax=Drosophila biarmipes TaxID=125945 RepID=UPI001CDA7CDC|nr:asparagine synthetase domain-containing protein CG17486 [Drosophila biarmipes]